MEEFNCRDNYLSAEIFEDYRHPIGAFVENTGNNENYDYVNAATCPDCGSGMIRQGGCCSCISCGFSSCSL